MLWLALLSVGLRLARRGRWVALVVPLVTLGVWVAVVSAGGAWLGWTA